MSSQPWLARVRRSRDSLATRDQLHVERLARRLAAAPAVREAATSVAAHWRARLTTQLGSLSAGASASLEPSVEELAFAYAQKVANGDPDRPKVSWIESPPHRWFGHDVPGGRYAGDNPDTIYRMVPIDGASTYRISGRFLPERPATTLFQVVADVNTLTTVSQLDGTAVHVEPDGTFALAIDATADRRRPNHLCTEPAVVQLFIRDTLSDWNTQTPPALAVQRTAGPRPAASKRFAALVADTVTALQTQDWIDFYILGLHFRPPPNTLSAPLITASTARSFGNYDLDDADTLVITAVPAGAAYFAVAVQNVWTITPDYWNHQSSLTNSQATANPDGTFTFVVATLDPRVANWIDTTGLRDGTLFVRWQDLPGSGGIAPAVTTTVVPRSALDAALPPGTLRVTPVERAAQLANRRAGFNRRITTR